MRKRMKPDCITDHYLLSITRDGDQIKGASIFYTGSIRRSEKESIKYRILFWQEVDQALNRLSVSDELKHALRHMLEKKVRRPSGSEIEEYRKKLLSKSQYESLLRKKDHVSIEEHNGKQHKQGRNGSFLH